MCSRSSGIESTKIAVMYFERKFPIVDIIKKLGIPIERSFCDCSFKKINHNFSLKNFGEFYLNSSSLPFERGIAEYREARGHEVDGGVELTKKLLSFKGGYA